MRASERRTEAEEVEKRFFSAIIRKARQLHGIKKQQRDHSQDSGKIFPLRKTSKKHVSKIVFGKPFEQICYFCESHSAEKAKNGQLCS